MIRVLVVDDHLLIREGVAAIIGGEEDMALVGEASDGQEAIAQFVALRPDITLMDIRMPVVNGTRAIAAITAQNPGAKIIGLTTYAGDVQAARAVKAGAQGYLLKSSLRKDMLEVIRAVHNGARHIDPGVMTATHNSLTDRETAVLRLVAIGRANKQIAKALDITEETVKAHLKSVFAKLNVADRTHAVTEAVRRGIIEL